MVDEGQGRVVTLPHKLNSLLTFGPVDLNNPRHSPTISAADAQKT
jgi:hypothetical protein